MNTYEQFICRVHSIEEANKVMAEWGREGWKLINQENIALYTNEQKVWYGTIRCRDDILLTFQREISSVPQP
jgi:hypothetical protein